MKRYFQFAFLTLLIVAISPARLAAQADYNSSDGAAGNVSLGDLARYLREHKQPQAAPVIDNDNFEHVLNEAEKKDSRGFFRYAIDSVKNMFQVSSEDVSCSLSFNANASALLTDYSPHKIPGDVMAKFSSSARIDGGNLEVALNNASSWTVREITVGLTIVHPDDNPENGTVKVAGANLLPASLEAIDPATDVAKQPDTTLLLHLKANSTPGGTTVFREALNAPLAPGEQWHWAIIDAQGIPSSSTSQPGAGVIAGNPASLSPSQASAQLSPQASADNPLSPFRQISIPETGPLAFPTPSTPSVTPKSSTNPDHP